MVSSKSVTLLLLLADKSATALKSLYQSPETDSVLTWQDAKSFCEDKDSVLVTRNELCDYFKSEPLESGDQWAPALTFHGEEWIQVGGDVEDEGFCHAYDVKEECPELAEETASPTQSPTVGPPELFVCDPEAGGVLDITIPSDGQRTVALSKEIPKDTVCILERTSDGAAFGRLFGKNDWERSALSPASYTMAKLSFDCDKESCMVAIPDDKHEFQLVTYRAPKQLNPKEEASRFLAQTTYGPRMDEIEAFAKGGNNYKGWIEDQMNEKKTPPSLHREYFRRRANQRIITPNGPTRPRRPCEHASRWHSFAFTEGDVGTEFSLTKAGGSWLISQKSGGKAKMTEVDGAWLEALDPSVQSAFVVCSVEEAVNGAIEVDECSGKCKNKNNFVLSTNPSIQFDSSSIDSQEVVANKVELQLLDPPLDGVRISDISDKASCSEPGNVDLTLGRRHLTMGDQVLFLQDAASKSYYRHDARIVLLENTPGSVASPLTLTGGLMEGNKCPNVALNFVNQDSCYVTDEPMCGSEEPLTVVCGSIGEVANDPSVGSRLPFDCIENDEKVKKTEDHFYSHQTSKSTWIMLSLYGNDQLRQRVAFALSGILVVGYPAYQHHEARMVYYDIFVRHAFGNYRDVLKEVSHHSLMGDWLTFRGSKSYPSSGTLPDENYARELLQLFSIGLNKLEKNGDTIVHPNGNPVPTYDIEDIMSIARVWTGFQEPAMRGNIENYNHRVHDRNRIDPMRIDMRYKDVFPKTDVMGGYIGDRYPLCIDFPEKDFLRKGAVYDFVGSSDQTGLVLESGSKLYNVLCSGNGGKCNYAAKVTLDSNLPCMGAECNVDHVERVRVGDAVYKVAPRNCVNLQFFNGGQTAAYMTKDTWSWLEACVDPRERHSVYEACCKPITKWKSDYFCPTEGFEYVTFESNANRCQEKGLELCYHFNRGKGCGSECCPTEKQYGWSGVKCSLKVTVSHGGQIATMHDVQYPHALLNEERITWYDVDWVGEKDIPNVNKNACGSCEAVGSTCVCEINVLEEAGFLSMPTKEDVLSQLKVGSAPPEVFDSGSFVEEQSSDDGLKVHRRSDGSLFDTDTIFEVEDEVGNVVYLKNIISTVEIGNGMARFRNPPAFLNIFQDLQGDQQRANFEVDALLNHLLAHPNTAPFIAYRLIQRLTTSNPSPTYIEAVANAFRTGSYEGIGSGSNGDLGATVAAVLLHEEARTSALDADPSQGQLREPLLKIIYPMRSLEVQTSEPGTQIMMRNGLRTSLGQMAHESETVFSWFLPAHSSLGTKANEMGLVTPESEIMTAPKVIWFMNAMMSFARFGVTPQWSGVGDSWEVTPDLTYESTSKPETRQYELPSGLDLTIEKGYIKGNPATLPEGMTITIEQGEGDKCHQQDKDGVPYRIYCKLEETISTYRHGYGSPVAITGSGGSVAVDFIFHLAFKGKTLFFPATEDLAQVNAKFRPGDTLTITHSTTETKCTQEYKDDQPWRVWCRLEPTEDGAGLPNGIPRFDVTGTKSGKSFSAGIHHWASSGWKLFMYPDVSIEEVNDALLPGSAMTFSVVQGDPTDELDLLLTNGRLSDQARATIAEAQKGILGYGKDSALRYAVQLFFMTAEYHISNIPNGLQRSLPAPPEEPPLDEQLKPAKTIVYLQLAGGADSMNMLVPHSECRGDDLHANYTSLRSDIAIPKDQLHKINVPSGSQPCKKFGMHPSLKFLSTMYNDGDLLWVANTGSLVEPVTRDELKKKKTPNNNFAHNIMTNWLEKAHTNNNRALGILGRIADSLKGKFRVQGFSLRNTSPMQENDLKNSPNPDFISMNQIEILERRSFLDAGMEDAIQNFTVPCTSVYCDLWSSALRKGIKRTEKLKAVTDAHPLEADEKKYWKNDDSSLEKGFRQISRVMAGGEDLDIDRLTFTISKGGFDAHFDTEEQLAEPLVDVDTSLESFVAEMKAQGKWNEVVVVIGSEFARGLVSNGLKGCDHGWGGNYMVLGGDIKGGQILGDYIDNYDIETNPLMMRAGRVIPTTPWEAVWNGISEWFDVPSHQMDEVLPLKGNFPGRIFSEGDMFKGGKRRRQLLAIDTSPSHTETMERKQKTCEIDPNYIVCKKEAEDTDEPTGIPTTSPTALPTEIPTHVPTTLSPTVASLHPSVSPTTAVPTAHPTATPTSGPTRSPTSSPTEADTIDPTWEPTSGPTKKPTDSPTESPTHYPTHSPTDNPTSAPTESPTDAPTDNPTVAVTEVSTEAELTSKPVPENERTPAPEPETRRTPAPVTKPPKTLPPSNTPPGSFGDPHVKVWSGETFDFHGSCDLVLLDNPRFHDGLGMTVQIRTKIVTWWSFIEAAVVRVGSESLEVTGGRQPKYYVNGVEGDIASKKSFLFSALGLETVVRQRTKHQVSVRIDLGNGDALGLETFKEFVRVNVKMVDPKWKKFEGSVGLMGMYPTGARFGRDGKTVFTDMNAFGQEWQVRESEPMLFHNADGPQHPSKCLMPEEATAEQKRRRLGKSMITREEAELACARVGGSDHDACVFDVLATNNKDMAGVY